MGKKKKHKYENLMEMDDKEYLKYLKKNGYEVEEPSGILGVLGKKQLKKIEKLGEPITDDLTDPTVGFGDLRKYSGIQSSEGDEDEIEELIDHGIYTDDIIAHNETVADRYKVPLDNTGMPKTVDISEDDGFDASYNYVDFVLGIASPYAIYSVEDFKNKFCGLKALPAQLCTFIEFNGAVFAYFVESEKVFGEFELAIGARDTIDMSDAIVQSLPLLIEDGDSHPLDVNAIYAEQREVKDIADEFYLKYKAASERIESKVPMSKAILLADVKNRISSRLTSFIYSQPIKPSISSNIFDKTSFTDEVKTEEPVEEFPNTETMEEVSTEEAATVDESLEETTDENFTSVYDIADEEGNVQIDLGDDFDDEEESDGDSEDDDEDSGFIFTPMRK